MGTTKITPVPASLGPVPIKKMKPGFKSKQLRYDYRRPQPPSATFRKATPFSFLKNRAVSRHDPELRGGDWFERFVIEYDVFSPLNRIFQDGELDWPSGGGWTKKQQRVYERRLSKGIRGKYLLLRAVIRLRESGQSWASIQKHLGVTEYRLRQIIKELSEMFGKEALRHRYPETRLLVVVPKTDDPKQWESTLRKFGMGKEL